MNSLYSYTDYRDLLRDYYESRKAEGGFMSYRWLGRKLNVDPSLLVKILRNERHLTEDSFPSLQKLLAGTAQEADFIEALYLYSRATQEAEMAIHYERMKQVEGVQATRLSLGQYVYYESWRNSALWALLHTRPNEYISYYAERLHPRTDESQVLESLELLEKLGMLTYDADGKRILTARHLQSGSPLDRALLRGFYHQMLDLAAKSLDEIPAEDREISGITVAADSSCLEDIKEIIREARRKIQRRVEEVEHAQGVYQIGFQAFPLSSFETLEEVQP